ALSMILPPRWPSSWIYFGVVTVLSLIGWTGLARVVRGQYLSLREKEFVVAARAIGSSDGAVMFSAPASPRPRAGPRRGRSRKRPKPGRPPPPGDRRAVPSGRRESSPGCSGCGP